MAVVALLPVQHTLVVDPVRLRCLRCMSVYDWRRTSDPPNLHILEVVWVSLQVPPLVQALVLAGALVQGA